jgi:zinc protease
LDAGFFGTYTATSPENEIRARDILLDECARLAREPVDEHELADAKEALRGEQVVHTQTFSSQAGEMVTHRLYGRSVDETERYLSRIDAVSRDEIMAVAARYLRPETTWVGVVRGQRG